MTHSIKDLGHLEVKFHVSAEIVDDHQKQQAALSLKGRFGRFVIATKRP